MNTDSLRERERAIADAAKDAVWTVTTTDGGRSDLERHLAKMEDIQETCCAEFPRVRGEVEFWETLWRYGDKVRDQWDRVERALEKVKGEDLASRKKHLDAVRRRLYRWMREWIHEYAPRVPQPVHFELGIERQRSDYRGLHERVEGLYEAIKRMGRLPEIRRDVVGDARQVNFAIIYGGGWNVSTYSILREAAEIGGLNALCAFDHPGEELYGEVNGREVRLATAGMCRSGPDEYALVTFREPQVLHFICPHQWTGPRPHTLHAPLLRSDLTLEIVNNKLMTTRALEWYREKTGADIPLIPEETVDEPAVIPVSPEVVQEEADRALARLEESGSVQEVVVKPGFGMEETDVGYFSLPEERADAVQHAARLAVESGTVLQQRIRPPGGMDYNWRVMIARGADGDPKPVGRFARLGHHEQMEMVPDAEMLSRVGETEAEAVEFLERLNRVSIDAFRAVAEYAEYRHPDFPHKPLGDGSYAEPYFLGMDLIGNARVMEVNGHEVAGMWTDDRLYPETRGRSNRTVLEAGLAAGKAYKKALEGRNPNEE